MNEAAIEGEPRSQTDFLNFILETTMNTITSSPLRTLVAGAVLSALAFSFATTSSANERATPPKVIVKFGDLDLSTSQGAVALYSRIHSAAVNVCSRMFDSDFAYKLKKDVCLQEVITDAVNHVGQPTLSAVFASRYRMPQPAVLTAAKAP
jgi:UrcA family protein